MTSTPDPRPRDVPDAGRARARRRRPLRAAVTLLVVAAVGTGAVVVALNRLDDETPVAERCAATADGRTWYLSVTQADNAALVAGTAVRRGFPARAATIGLATALQESRLVNIDYGDRDSVGLFQQRPSQGWGSVEQIMDPVYSTNAFYDVLETVDGYEAMEVTVAAQTVQRSAFPDAYAQHEPRSRAWASALTGWSPASLTCDLAPVAATEIDADTPPTQPFRDRLARDLGDGARVAPLDGDTSTVAVDTTGLPGAGEDDGPARTAWAVAQWAVATADATNVVAVDVADRRWSRDDSTWVTLDPETSTPLDPGRVRVQVAAPDPAD
ncbi:hypothetical protein [Cellulosimicrobium composti]|uniref:Heavy metal transporter n=1 Tax=Cellulosimicrobium composti TaxID=2672572 RepID=A0ABX0BA46_9MICO|nr:hypothetical protein [Cellulosimicrobium composti]NDO89459.1 hypothetical protein [Cellulosimicrobium composti]